MLQLNTFEVNVKVSLALSNPFYVEDVAVID